MAEHEHGTSIRYKNEGCRCDACRAANAAAMREYRSDPAVLEQQNAYRSEYRLKPRPRRTKRNWDYRRMYGITVDDYDRMFAEQDGRCALCRTDTPNGPSKEHFMVDHDHATGRVRGLLCGKCNTILGYLGDDPERARRVIEYLSRG